MDKNNNNIKKKPSILVHFIAGGIGGTCGAAITCPLEVVKTRLQSSLYRSTEINNVNNIIRNPFKAVYLHCKGVFSLLYKIKEKEGIKALWKGLGPNLLGVVPARAIYFTVYSQGKHFYSSILNNGNESPLIHMLSAANAGIAVASFTNPIWLIKTRMQLQSNQLIDIKNTPSPQQQQSINNSIKYKNSLHCFLSVIQNEGVKGLYRGWSASLLGLVESSLQFTVYEFLKKEMYNHKLNNINVNTKFNHDLINDMSDEELGTLKNKNVIELGFLDTFTAAAISKLGAALLTYPHEVLRTRMRQTPIDGKTKYEKLIPTLTTIYKEEGMIALYGGMTAHLMRVVPNAAILFFCYELVVKTLNKSNFEFIK